MGLLQEIHLSHYAVLMNSRKIDVANCVVKKEHRFFVVWVPHFLLSGFHVIYILEFKRVSDTGEKYVSENQKLTEIQHLAVTQGLKFKDTQWTVVSSAQLSL